MAEENNDGKVKVAKMEAKLDMALEILTKMQARWDADHDCLIQLIEQMSDIQYVKRLLIGYGVGLIVTLLATIGVVLSFYEHVKTTMP